MFIGETAVSMTPTAADAGATITVNGTSVASGQASAALTLNPGQNPITIVVTAADGVTVRTYILTANRLSQEAYIKASNTGVSDSFGRNVALSGDTLAVGVTGEDSNAGDKRRSEQRPFLTAGRCMSLRRGRPGCDISIVEHRTGGIQRKALSGDTLAVGAPFESSNAVGIGGDQNNNLGNNSGAEND
jgi:hypothetical protein